MIVSIDGCGWIGSLLLSKQAWAVAFLLKLVRELFMFVQQHFHATVKMWTVTLTRRLVTVTITPRVRSSNKRKERAPRVPNVAMRHRRPKTSACQVSLTQTLKWLEVVFLPVKLPLRGSYHSYFPADAFLKMKQNQERDSLFSHLFARLWDACLPTGLFINICFCFALQL